MAAEIDEIEHGNRELNVILRLATAVDEAWLMELFPTAFSERTEVAFDASGKRVISKQVTLFRDVAKDQTGWPPRGGSGCLAPGPRRLERALYAQTLDAGCRPVALPSQ